MWLVVITLGKRQTTHGARVGAPAQVDLWPSSDHEHKHEIWPLSFSVRACKTVVVIKRR